MKRSYVWVIAVFAVLLMGTLAPGLKFSDYMREFAGVPISRGDAANLTAIYLNGYNAAVGTSYEDIWRTSGTISLPAAAGTVTVVSGDANDDGAPAGTGARTLVIECLIADYTEDSETLTLNGTTNVVSTLECLRVNKAYVATAGSGGVNAGAITGTIGGNNQFTIAIGENISQKAIYTVPEGKTAYIMNWDVCTDTGGSNTVDAEIVTRVEGGIWIPQKQTLARRDGPCRAVFAFPVEATEHTDIKIRAKISGGTQIVAANTEILLVTE